LSCNWCQAGKTAFHYAAANGYSWVVVEVLLRYDAEMDQCGDATHRVRRFDPDRPDNMGNTALMLAVRRNHVQVDISLHTLVPPLLYMYNCAPLPQKSPLFHYYVCTSTAWNPLSFNDNPNN